MNISRSKSRAEQSNSASSSDNVKPYFVGNLYGEQFHDGYAGAVFSVFGISPTVTTRSVLSGALLLLINEK